MGRDMAMRTLATAGTISVAFDIADAVYLAGGPGDEAGRLVAGIGSMVGGGVLAGGGALALLTVGEDANPGGSGGPEEAAMHTARTFAAVDIALAAVSVGLGISTVATYRSSSSDPAPRMGALGTRLRPVVVPGRSGFVGVAGQF